jgi:transposase
MSVTRELRALKMLRGDARVAKVLGSHGEYVVPSQSGSGFYRVRVGEDPSVSETCTCPDFEERRAPCKHIYLVRMDQRAEDDPSPSHYSHSPLAAEPPKRNWSVYNESQTEEYRLFNTLLRDLSIGFPEPQKDPHAAGRKPIPLRDQVFCSVQRAYLGFSLRRSHGFRAEAARNGLISDTPFWSVPSRFLCRADVTEGLHDMLARSAIPLIGLEDKCAVDSTGLRTTRFNYYRQEKYNPSRENAWLKMHALVGVKTHVIPVLEVTSGTVSDSPQLPALLQRATANGFRFKEVLADKGYQSRENFNAADQLGIVPYIPFKRNQTGKSGGSPLYHKMFLFFQLKREEFDVHYGQRAQVESTFGSFKQKFGETIASRNFTAQLNEVLSLAIAHNITVMVRQMFEAGILPDFLCPPEGTDSPDGLRQPTELAPSLSLNRTPAAPPVTLSAVLR